MKGLRLSIIIFWAGNFPNEGDEIFFFKKGDNSYHEYRFLFEEYDVNNHTHEIVSSPWTKMLTYTYPQTKC